MKCSALAGACFGVFSFVAPSVFADAGTDSGAVDSGGQDGAPTEWEMANTSATACVEPGNFGQPAETDAAWFGSCDDLCMTGFCVPDNVLAADSGSSNYGKLDFFPACTPVSHCVPRFLIETLGDVHFKTCRSIGDSEGRCVPSCLKQIQAQLVQFLPTAGCEAGEICAPCYDPRTGAATGACTQGCDPGPTEPPYVFAPCCPVTGDSGGSVNVGMCVPPELVPAGAEVLFRAEGCAGTTLCVPQDLNSISTFACIHPVGGDSGAPDGGVLADASAGGAGGSTASGGASAGGSSNGGTTGSGGSGTVADAGSDASTGSSSKDDGGCGCRLDGSRSNPSGNTALIGLVLGAAAARGAGRRPRRAVRS